MDRFAVLPPAEKAAYIEMTAAHSNMSPELVEKDFWVCWTLKQIFSLDEIGTHITFKGGTSLSKCFNAIQRFSEDIDIAIERTYLEHERNIEPSLEESNKENKRRIEELMSSARSAIEKKILPGLRQKIESVLGHDGPWSLDLDPEDSLRQTLLFEFPTAVAERVNEYIKPVVRIELGARADHWPAQSAQVVPYVAGSLRNAWTVQPATVKVLSAERTFWEKVMILHRLYHSPDDKAVSKRMSRHYYDVYEMGRAGIFENAIERGDIMQSVVDFNRLFFRYAWLNYDEARRGSFRLVPHHAESIKSLTADYRQMEPMFFKEPPAFDLMIVALQSMEDRINKV